MNYLCARCYSDNKIDDLRSSGKVKNLSVESSRNLKCCKNCNSKVFILNNEKREFN